ncbi:hypothetical protein K504DRAFT_389560 [Pleomassaria siparia CBS 279.74]|uniref:Uncharacterized protein n=1 Tax=Pleomassaria siparia CBS 279.74 TaxID=1314801 RepID=A0A6G1JWG6_9PLEO|nr:hypothetical protein K504DRAFT_389560 [Pleomassaria siparia CBS 279.74]
MSPSPGEELDPYIADAAVRPESSSASSLSQCAHPLESVPPLFPLPAVAPFTLPTPDEPQSGLVDLDLVSGLLPDIPLPSPSVVKVGYNLRLPSFETLGIAAPSLYSGYSFMGSGPLSKPEDPLHALSPPLGPIHQLDGPHDPIGSTSGPSANAHIDHLVPVFTPSEEADMPNWASFVNVRTAGVGSPPSSDPGVSPSILTTTSPSSTTSRIVPIVVGMNDAVWRAAWIEELKKLITSGFGSQHLTSVKILSHALPCPSPTGHLFGELIAAIHEGSTSETAWINVFHAVPSRFTLSDLPKSPPSTPGPAVGGDEYFTSKVFDSAVAVPDYQLESKLLPPSPRPVVAPGSVNVSVVERYIPPTNMVEFAEMFTVKGHSLLYDRLIELSSDDGLLLFIYPTKTGARTFMRDYLGPILDPLLRSITVVNELSADLGKSLGQMASVERLIEYPSLHTEIQRFCHKLSESSPSLQATDGKKSTYSILHTEKEEIVLSREAWADWWIKQEKPRVREAVTMNFRKAKKLALETELMPSNLIQEVLDGVMGREYEAGRPKKGIEVGVFIIKKSC